jgi:hydroxymethylpyrimidine/phosphomethylpyrimidine kinase
VSYPARVALTIAGSDSGGGAGIQADLKTFAALGVFGTSAITAITAQNTRGVAAVDVLRPEMVYAQVKSVAEDFEVGAAKTGMLADAKIIEAVVRAVADFKILRLVVDTVMVSKSGHRLLAAEAETALRGLLLPIATLITPNLPEAEVLLGEKITNVETMREAAKKLHRLGAKHVLLKGGHLDGNQSTDVFYDGKEIVLLEGQRIATTSTHGTGCTLSAAITAHLALGKSVLEACRAAKAYLTGAIRHAVPLGGGHGPVNHNWLNVAARGKRAGGE